MWENPGERNPVVGSYTPHGEDHQEEKHSSYRINKCPTIHDGKGKNNVNSGGLNNRTKNLIIILLNKLIEHTFQRSIDPS